jgi:transposase
MQIHSKMLVVGIDIGKSKHFARAFDYRGIELGKLLKFANSAQGYEALDDWMAKLQRKHQLTEVIVGFEPTGHYWFTLGDHLKRQGHQLAIVNPYHVKCTRELDDNSPSKSDHKDPMTIAMLVKDGRFRDVYIPKDVYQELREAVGERERIVEQMVTLNNQIIRWLDIRFPEWTKVFKSWKTGITARIVLKEFCTPAAIVEAGVDNIMTKLEETMQRPSRKKVEQLIRVASISVGRVEGSEAATMALRNLLAMYEMAEEQQTSIERTMEELLLQVPNAGKLVAIKGVGPILAAVMVSEIGDISRFEDPRQIIKLAGLNLRENSSGKHQGKTTISKRGRRLLRYAVFRTMIAMLATNAEFRQLHKQNLTRDNKPMSKMQSVIALCGKFIRVTYAVLTKGVSYDPGKVIFGNQERLQAA